MSIPAHKKKPTPPPRLWVVRAKDAPVAVIFRRGPSKQVELILWNMRKDTFERGQWFKGRIYERRCDLSPDGKYLIYFAAKHTGPFGTWTAISRPPYLTALALWSKGDCWNGGGWFLSERGFVLNHPPQQTEMAKGFCLRKLRMEKTAAWRGEDDTVWVNVLDRDGWKLTKRGAFQELKGRGWIATEPETWVKPHPRRKISLEMATVGVLSSDRWYDMRFRVFSEDGDIVPPSAWDWADWNPSGDLVYAENGCIHRAKFRQQGIHSSKNLIDFTEDKFSNVSTPPLLAKW